MLSSRVEVHTVQCPKGYCPQILHLKIYHYVRRLYACWVRCEARAKYFLPSQCKSSSSNSSGDWEDFLNTVSKSTNESQGLEHTSRWRFTGIPFVCLTSTNPLRSIVRRLRFHFRIATAQTSPFPPTNKRYISFIKAFQDSLQPDSITKDGRRSQLDRTKRYRL